MALPLLQEQERWTEMVAICEQASGIGADTDAFLVYEMQALIAMGQPEQAVSAYEAFREILWAEFEIEPTEQMEQLYLLAEGMCQNHVDEGDILRLVAEQQVEERAFFCTFGVFQSIVALERRHLERTGDPIARLNAGSYLLMLTGATEENARIVMERLDRAFHKTYSHSKACISFRTFPLKPQKTVEN
ncbi:BTAD domain-containing putative transcriptional regulator [Candidatus Merdisoma sp. JLR.KK011]|uniref:BTAD domain-containing putative transcriptional regulator n=1 Tax=Candidatus Merdisoma sp. JLR.KK011 TaxID=3114299 RepID=UPI002FEF91D8